MATVYDVAPQTQSLLADATALGLLPPELLRVIQAQASALSPLQQPPLFPTQPSPNLLDAIAEAALLPRLTGPLFVHFEPLFSDICARWMHPQRQDDAILAAFARVLPLAPYLSVLLDRYLLNKTSSAKRPNDVSLHTLSFLCQNSADPPSPPADRDLVRILLCLWRLVNFDVTAYGRLVPANLQHLFHHSFPPVRYLAIRVFCRLHAAADFKLETMLHRFISEEDSLLAEFDGIEADYTFLTLYEHARCKEWHDRVLDMRAKATAQSTSPYLLPLTHLVAAWGRSVVPRPTASTSVDGVTGPIQQSLLIKTEMTLGNLEALAECLKNPEPILLRGLPGSGKTSLVREAARELGMAAGLVTLHLNEQTDSKTLIGLYTTGSKPGSFQWRPGVLTAAVQEGRWVLIEDLDRAPNEVMSTILPLIERRELLIPSRRETIKASRNFRIFATVRTSLGLNGQETAPPLLGERLWQQFTVQPLPASELSQVIHDSFPSLRPLITDMLSAFDHLTSSAAKKAAISLSAIERPVTLRDLMKWCRRVDYVVFRQRSQGNVSKATSTPEHAGTLSETALLGIFLDAVDCFAGSVKNKRVRHFVGQRIAKALRIRSDVAEHTLSLHEPQFHDGEKRLAVGRVTLRKPRKAATRFAGKPKGRPFATTAHARRLLEQISVAVELAEPLLLVGETGIGKTAVVQQLADLMGHKLVVVNLSQQSEVGDLLGGFKPVNGRSLAMPLQEEFEDLFAATGMSAEKNEKYLRRISASIARGKWADVCRLWQQTPKMFAQSLEQLSEKQSSHAGDISTTPDNDGQPTKRRKTESSKLATLLDLKPRWDAFSEKLEQFEKQIAGGSAAFVFAFVEGKIVQAVRNGDWLLLDEINLASPDTLESIADLLSSGPGDVPSILLSETGEIDKIEAHPNFRVFGAMNPATDVGKRDLPIGLRSRFTELYVASPDRDVQDLVPIIKTYLKGNAKASDRIIERVARLYLAIKSLAEERRLVDGANEVPHYSLRTLTRVLRYVDDVAPFYGLERALFEGFCMGFLTFLSQASENLVMPLILKQTLGDATSEERRQAILSQPPKTPSDGRPYIRFYNKEKDRQYWLMQGAELPQERSDYIRTAYVERNLLNLVRATSTRRFPILIQGPTSAGKTSMIEYLAHFSGNKFVRINNHEHTDLQEYLGTYVTGADGKLRFQDGVLVQAMRQGHWIVLDELNLAPTDVLEALNRLLDDNRELLIPETQEVVRPHDSFMLFATQNPAGLYGGRKVLSRAFRNRFLELHFDDIPEGELEYILQMRCRNTAPSDCKRIVKVYKELSQLRRNSRALEAQNSFATLRDLFRWALREADNRDQIACHGFMLLAERVRDEEERMAVKDIIEKVFKTKLNLEAVYGWDASPGLRRFAAQRNLGQQVVWTKAMRRLFVLVSQALKNHEPVLLVGETGCGKTTICQLVAEAAGRQLHIVNAHQNTETGDLIGSQRPVRNRAAIFEALRHDLLEALSMLTTAHTADSNETTSDDTVETLLEKYKLLTLEQRSSLPSALVERIARSEVKSRALFEWSDGSLVHAMKTGDFFLLDEISLADDSVLERLNSVLEPQRSLLLAEKGVGEDDLSVHADDNFQFLATMNPGGDFGKKELSPALRNRFTEIWVPPLIDSDDVLAIVSSTLSPGVSYLAETIVAFSYWFGRTLRASSATPFSIRDILVWAQFVNKCSQISTPEFALIHGAATVFIDTLGANPSAIISADATVAEAQRELCLQKLGALLNVKSAEVSSIYRREPVLRASDDKFWAGDFSIERSSEGALDASFEFEAPTTKVNVMRVVRALQMNHKPVLLEGNPGVGKTTLVSALARACGRPLTRINLSDQTDLMDLFGTDVPVEGAEAGNFAWRDAPFLQAMQKGEWVLLDEMNLAPQTVLEGLNACLDHRGEVYIAELDQTFKRHKDFRLFAAQNPHHQGGGRKGLPSSFVNRFIVVYADVFTEVDQLRIAHKRYPSIPAGTVRNITNFVAALEREIILRPSFGLQGAPWEFNLRDTLRWLELVASLPSSAVQDYLDITIRQRFRTARDRQQVANVFATAFGRLHEPHSLYHTTAASVAQVGLAVLGRNLVSQPTPNFPGLNVIPRLPELESLLVCVQNNLPCILVGPSGAGKSALLQHVAALAGKPLVVFPLSADVDAMDLVGGFEQADPVREVYGSLSELEESLELFLLDHATQEHLDDGAEAAAELLQAIHLRPQNMPNDGNSGEATYFARLSSCISRLASLVDSQSQLATAMSRAYDLLQQPLTLDNPRFEWLDSVIVHAAQAGRWLVLDNANLCNASVLDRLNSLLERPHGFLSINEHTRPDGTPRIVELHPDFRVFLTADPQYGELSRAMRNRSVEIYMDNNELKSVGTVHPYKPHITPVEARMQRYLDVTSHIGSTEASDDVDGALLWLDNLSLADQALLFRFLHAAEAGNLIKASSDKTRLQAFFQRLRAVFTLVNSPDAEPIRKAILQQYDKLASSRFGEGAVHGSSSMQLRSLFVHEQPLHPLQNASLLRDHQNFWLGVRFERYAGVYDALRNLQSQAERAAAYLSRLSQLSRLQRSSLSGQVAILARDSTSHAYHFLENVAQQLLQLCVLAEETPTGDGRTERYMLNIVWHFWWRTHSLTSQAAFDEAKFQAHLGHGRRLLERAKLTLKDGDTIPTTHKEDELFYAFVSSVARRLESDFAAGFKLTTGLSIETLWPLLRPLPIPESTSFRLITTMERLAARFDNLKWRVSGASMAELGETMTALAEVYRQLRVNSTDAESLAQELADEIAKLEAQAGENDQKLRRAPLFADIFEAVRQLHVLHGATVLSKEDQLRTLVLSNLSTLAQLRLRSATGLAGQLQNVDYFLSQNSTIRPWSGMLPSELLHKCDIIASSSTLASLQSLERELPFAGKVVARSSALILSDPVVKLNRVLLDLLVPIIASHDESLQASIEALFEKAIGHPQIASIAIADSGLVVASTQLDRSGGNLPAQQVIWPGLEKSIESSWPEHIGQHLAVIMKEHFLVAILALAAMRQDSNRHLHQSLCAVAWVQFAIGCIKLYTPDKVFDPYLKWYTEQEFDETLRESLIRKAEALRQFERSFTNQDATAGTNLRVKLVQDDIAVLDANALTLSKKDDHQQLQTLEIYRPPSTGSSSDLSRLQKEVFNPVLNVTVKDDLSSAHYRLVASSHRQTVSADTCEELQLVQNNVVQLIERLLTSFTAYQDLAVPLANLLRCLQLGLSLSQGRHRSSSDDDATAANRPASTWLTVTPFLGGKITRIEDVPASISHDWEFLLFSGVCANVDGGNGDNGGATLAFSPDGRRRVIQCFHFFFEQWKKKLDADRKAEEDKNNIYRFRGSQEDEEEMDAAEFSELFPTYYEDNGDNGERDGEQKLQKSSAAAALSAWDLSADVAKVHRDIIQPSRPATEVVMDFIKMSARNMVKEKERHDESSYFSAEDAAFLPATMLVLDDKLQDLQNSKTATTAAAKTPAQYNFYTDANLPESRKLVALVHDTQVKFRSLQRVEEIGHLQPLADVVLATEKVLELGYAEPLAKLIPAVEKLHEFLYEWQFRGYASRQYATPTLYDRITATLIGWRKLELSTWSRLFDAEEEKCRQDISAWWFIAYQAAIAGPMTILLDSGHDVKDTGSRVLAYHAEQLLKELSSYLGGSIVGQYAARLGLLRQIQAHLALLVFDYPALSVICNAVQSFIGFHARYESKATETIKKGRDALQKAMNDVLLLASWRDTNIDALRESARKSHQKLFRLVRKFRAVLGQPMEPIILQGLPDDEGQGTVQGSAVPSLLADASIDLTRPLAAAKLCEQLIPGWGTDPHTRRLSSVDRIVGIMGKASTLPPSALDASDVVSAFVTDLQTSMTALRKETPGLLTEENKDVVKHLKTRKIRLFDDTVKAVRQMGFSNNLGSSRLAAQASLAMIFSGYNTTRLPDGLDLAGLEYSFHKLINLAPRFRDALHDHHSDLHRVTARRSVGYLEGILFVTLHQRELLARSSQGLVSLESQIAYVESLSIGIDGQVTENAKSSSSVQLEVYPSSHSRTLRWLLLVIRVAIHLVDVHARLAAADCQSIHTQLQKWADKLQKRNLLFDTAPVLPTGFISSETLKLQRDIEEDLQFLNSDLDSQIKEAPELAYILGQVKLWTSTDGNSHTNGTSWGEQSEKNLTKFTDEVLDLSKKILDAVQKFNKPLSELPTSVEEVSWLVNYNTKLSTAVKALHVDTIVGSIGQCIDSLRSVYRTESVEASIPAALLRVLLPLLQQYAATYRHSLIRLATLHRSTCQLGHRLSHSFVEIASQGFCTPPDKSAGDDTNQTSGKLEEGTGLGDGEGAEDISKDIQPDEDLSELAQTANKEKDKDDGEGIEDEKDAVDMGNDEMEGELGSVSGEDDDKDEGSEDKDEDDEEDTMDEEAGDVDDLDPTAVDEKMWDGEDDTEDADKEQQGNESMGQKNEEEDTAAAADDNDKKASAEEKQAAAGEEGKPEDEGDKEEDSGDAEEDDAIGSDDEQAGPQQELDRQDQNVESNDILDLPDDMELDNEDDGKDDEDDDFDDLDDLKEEGGIEDVEEKNIKEDEKELDGEVDGEENQDVESLEELESGDEGKKEEKMEDEALEVEGKDEDEEGKDDMELDEGVEESAPEKVDSKTNEEKAAVSDVQSGFGPEQDSTTGVEEQQDDSSAPDKKNSAKRDEGDRGQYDADEQETATGGDGTTAHDRENNDEQTRDEPSEQDAENQTEERQPFKKLGEVLERWHQTRREIKQAEEKLEETKNENSENQSAQKEFQHLYDEDAAANTQAMGAADDEEAKPFDDSMAIDEQQEKDGTPHHGNDESNDDELDRKDVSENDKIDDDDDNVKKTERDNGRTGATMQTGALDRVEEEDDTSMNDGRVTQEVEDSEDEDVTTQLFSTHLNDKAEDEASLVPMEEALRQWSEFQMATDPLSRSLTAQLRLILTPSQATRLSGGFRTGKRLNIRKIIAYIASQYKRDKIWMRRSVPTKRAYQILLCVDDSKSMGETSHADASSSPGHLALSSLVMVGRALAMLEAGQVGVIGFGSRIFTAHELHADQSFGGASGSGSGAAAQTLRRFTFQQDSTDVALLLRTTIDRFKEARAMNAATSNTDLWQLAIVLSDGLTPSRTHDDIRRLLREAEEARIIVVFVVLDTTDDANSVLNLRKTKFVDGIPIIERYLDTFPFRYYLIVRHLDDLPSALADLLRKWFEEVNR